MSNRPFVGNAVVYIDSQGVEHNALVCAVWGQDALPAINVAFLSADEKQVNSFGRQSLYSSSVVHQSQQSANAYYWRWPDEEPRSVTLATV